MSYSESDRQRQIEVLLGYPRVGALTPGAIAANLGVAQEDIQPILTALVQEGRLVRHDDCYEMLGGPE